jgi:glycine/D-amino acid oxidase-like deaminating enzyme
MTSSIDSITNQPIWDDERWQALPALEGEHTADVCVIGLGGSGLAAIGELLAQGMRVIGLDAGMVGGQAAGRNGGFLLAGLAAFYHQAVEAHGRALAARLYRLTLAEIERIAAETPAAARLTGSLRIAASPEEQHDCRRQLEAMQADGLPTTWYEGPEGCGLLVASDGAFQPLRRCRTLALRAIEGGAALFEHSRAQICGRDSLATPGGHIRCGAVIVAVDGGLERILPELSGNVQTLRLQMLATEPARDCTIPRPVYRRWGYDYWQQLPDRRLAVGGFRDIDQCSDGPAQPTPEVQAALEGLLRDTIGSSAAVTHRWAAHVAFTPDGLPICDEVRPGVWAAGAYSGTGNVIGALCGRALAQRIACGHSALWL